MGGVSLASIVIVVATPSPLTQLFALGVVVCAICPPTCSDPLTIDTAVHRTDHFQRIPSPPPPLALRTNRSCRSVTIYESHMLAGWTLTALTVYIRTYFPADTYRSKGGRWEDGTTPPQYPPSYPFTYAPDPRLPLRRPRFSCEKPKLKYLVCLPRVDWFNVGLQLDLEDDELTTIQKNHPHDDEQARREMYKLWLLRQPKASCQQLVDAMCRAGANAVADKICRKFGTSLFITCDCLHEKKAFFVQNLRL